MNNMKIIFFPSFEEQYNSLKGQGKTFLLYGREFDNFSVVHLTGFSLSKNSYPIGFFTTKYSSEEESLITTKTLEYPYVHIIIQDDLSKLLVNIHKNEGVVDSKEDIIIEKLDLNRLFVRIDQKETPLKILKEKKVAIIGMGSGGSLLALYLAKSGVKKFIFIDNDLLETHNIIRHICDLSNIGRFKTKAVKDFIEARIPDVEIVTIEKMFNIHTKADFDYFYNILKDVNLIAAVSGEHDVNYAINDFVHSNYLPIPIVYAGTFDGVIGGLMFKVDPRKDDYCYHCIYSNPENYGSIKTKSLPSPQELEQKITYDRTLQEQLAQPGLGLDIDNLTILLSKFCLDFLLDGTDHGLYRFPYNFYMWFNRIVFTPDKMKEKFEGLELYYYEDLKKEKICPFHGLSDLRNQLNEEEE